MRSKRNFTYNDFKKHMHTLIQWLALAVVIGVASGVLGALFSKSVAIATQLRSQNGWLLYLLPLGGLCSVAIYKLLKVNGVGTNQALLSTKTENKTPFLLAPAIFIGTVITHLSGGSAGREGAALQLGSGVSSVMASAFKLKEKSRRILGICGMGAFFAALFGTPFGALVFVLELCAAGGIGLSAFLPVAVSCFVSFVISFALGTEPERFSLNSVPDISLHILWKMIIIAAAAAIVSMIFCHTLRLTEKLFERLFKNEFLRIAFGGGIIILLTTIFKTTDYNGGGIDVIRRIFTDGDVRYEAFLLKIIFTAVTVAAGYKGGEIIPSLFIGSTLGGTLAGLLCIDPAFGAAVGISAFFCGVTKCPLASIFLSAEMFGAKGVIFFAFSSAIGFLLSGKTGLYSVQSFLQRITANMPIINKNSECDKYENNDI